MSRDERKWSQYSKEYDPIRNGSIDGTDTEPHDRGIIRAIDSRYKPNNHVKGDPRHTIFIGRLHRRTDEDKLKGKFRQFGRIIRCRVVRDYVTGQSKCYGFIEYETSSACREAIREMHRSYIHENEIIVDFECERTLKGWKPRRLGGGFGGQKESGQLRFGGSVRPFKRPYESDHYGRSHHDDYNHRHHHRRRSHSRSDERKK